MVENGTNEIAETLTSAASFQHTAQEVTTQVRLAAGDYVQLGVFTDSATTLQIDSLDDRSPVFAMDWISP